MENENTVTNFTITLNFSIPTEELNKRLNGHDVYDIPLKELIDILSKPQKMIDKKCGECAYAVRLKRYDDMICDCRRARYYNTFVNIDDPCCEHFEEMGGK